MPLLQAYYKPSQEHIIEKLKREAEKRGWSLSKYVMYLLEGKVK